ncbi:TonB-dependent receptor [Brevundimonas sp.]|uniref:TonB-dependent receptor n=1 Tax=Brevundimonas sp. TaxID=1871086 RepID=UPI003BAA4316
MTHTAKSDFRMGLLAATALVAATASPTLAQSIQNAPASARQEALETSTVDEIVVTALRRDQSLQDVPISITAITGETLADQGASNMNDYFRQVPGLSVEVGGPARQRISLRGVQSNGEATTGLYYDETPVTGPAGSAADAGAAQPDLNLFDVSRVEVLRGPQGTLYGSGSMGGTVRIIFNKARTDQYEGAVEAQATTVKDGGEGYILRGMVNIPLIEDKLGVRVTGFTEQRPGYVDNVRLGNEDVNEGELSGVRAMFTFTPTDTLTINGTAIFQTADYDDATTTWFKSAGDYQTEAFTKSPYSNDFALYNLTARWSLPFADLVATTSRTEWDSVYTSDYTSTLSVNRNGSCLAYFAVGSCTPDQQTQYNAYKDSRLPGVWHQPSTMESENHEIRLSSIEGSLFDWTVGAYNERRYDYFDSQVYRADPVTGNPLIIPGDETGWRTIETEVKQTAFFGEVSYTVFDRLTLTGGARYYDYTKSVGGEVLVANHVTLSALQPYQQVSVDATGWVTKLNAAFDVTPDIMVYATRSEGFRPGGANNVPGIPDTLLPYDADSLTNYETGVKGNFLDRRLTVNASIYQIDWDDMQINAQASAGAWNFITNAGASRMRGLELEAAARPMPGLDLTANFAYIDAELTEDQVNSSIILTANAGRKGDRIVGIPEESGAFSAAYRWSLTQAFDGMARVDYTYTGSAPTQLRTTNANYQMRPSYSLVNARVGIESDAFGLYLFVNNLLDDVAVTSITTNTGQGIYNRITTAAPRTIGVNLTKSF